MRVGFFVFGFILPDVMYFYCHVLFFLTIIHLHAIFLCSHTYLTIVGLDFCPATDVAERVVLYHRTSPPSLNRQLWNNRLSLAQRTYFLCRNIAYVLCIFLIDCMIFFALLLRSMTYVTIVTHVYVIQQMLQSLWTVRHTHHHHPTTTTYQHRFWYPFHHPGQDYSRG